MPLSDLKKNEDLVNQGILVIRKAEHALTIKHYRKATKPGTSGSCGYGWAFYHKFETLEDLNSNWNALLQNGAVEG